MPFVHLNVGVDNHSFILYCDYGFPMFKPSWCKVFVVYIQWTFYVKIFVEGRERERIYDSYF